MRVGSGRLEEDVSSIRLPRFGIGHTPTFSRQQPPRPLTTTRRIMAAPGSTASAPFSRLQLAAALLGMPINAYTSLDILTSFRV